MDLEALSKAKTLVKKAEDNHIKFLQTCGIPIIVNNQIKGNNIAIMVSEEMYKKLKETTNE